MATLTDADHYFSEPNNDTLCRLGGNGPINVSQVMPIIKYIEDGTSFLDVGCGSGTTLDVLKMMKKDVKYKGTDFIEHRIKWLKETYPENEFEVGDARHINEEDASWDTVWSRHVVEHTGSFEDTIDEHCRVAKKQVICILFQNLRDDDHDNITNVKYGDRVYIDEFYNQYSRSKVKKHLESKRLEGWEIIEFMENVSWDGAKDHRGDDTVIVLRKV